MIVVFLDHQKLPVQFLVYGAVGFVTTMTSCVAIYLEKDMSQMEKNVVLSFYSPFAAICMYPSFACLPLSFNTGY